MRHQLLPPFLLICWLSTSISHFPPLCPLRDLAKTYLRGCAEHFSGPKYNYECADSGGAARVPSSVVYSLKKIKICRLWWWPFSFYFSCSANVRMEVVVAPVILLFCVLLMFPFPSPDVYCQCPYVSGVNAHFTCSVVCCSFRQSFSRLVAGLWGRSLRYSAGGTVDAGQQTDVGIDCADQTPLRVVKGLSLGCV